MFFKIFTKFYRSRHFEKGTFYFSQAGKTTNKKDDLQILMHQKQVELQWIPDI